MHIGIDVGGTNTDAVLMDGDVLVDKIKNPTTDDVTSGIIACINTLNGSKPDNTHIEAVMLGTTHFVNALLQRKELAPSAALRLCLPATTMLPPLVDWPSDLKDSIGGHTYMASGGHEYDGREISPIDENELREIARKMNGEGVRSVSISGVFSTVDDSHEKIAADIIKSETPDMNITLSSEIGRIGILERENAAMLNACLVEVAAKTVAAIQAAMASSGLDVPLFFSQNDGTLMQSEFAAQYPVFTIASGPTNSMRGAAFLSGVLDAVIIDIGGTSTDGGMLIHGFPREAIVAVDVAGVRTNFRMPDVFSIALGGGSLIKQNPFMIGPESVGFRLVEDGIVFGGEKLTATDIAVASGIAEVGNPDLVTNIDSSFAEDTINEIQKRVEDVIDQLKISSQPVPVVLVGGGSILVKNSFEGASDILRPSNADVANAIGAAIAQVGGQVEKVYSLTDMSRSEALRLAKDEAINKAIEAGGDPKSIEIVDIEEIPLAYLPSNALRIKIKAVGDLNKPK
jgi:N-methylhydantoinase A/oxoprolinase/acetone carboxylase beta subunit